MSEAPLMNDAAARSPSGEILDQAPPATPTTPTPSTSSDSTTPPTDPKASTEPKPDAAKPATTPAPSSAPETYTDFKVPDGLTLSREALAEVTPVFKELGLTQDQAQKLVDFHAKQMVEVTKGPQQTYETMRKSWQDQVHADPEMGGKLDTIKTDVGRALNALGDPKLAADFKAAMDLTGAGDHPAFVKTLWKLSQFVTEGRHVAGGGPSPQGQIAPGASQKPSAARALYPNNP